MMAFADPDQFGAQKQRGIRFRVAFHLLREPLATIASPGLLCVLHIERGSGVSRLLKAASCVLGTPG